MEPLIRITILSFSTAIAILFIPAYPAKSETVCSHDFFRPYYRTRSHFCSAGEFVTDYYTGLSILCEEAEVDHIISLREAYGRGICGDDLRSLANDPDNLRLTHWTINRRKGARAIEDFLSEGNFSGSHDARLLAANIRARYNILNGEASFARSLSNSIIRRGINIPLTASSLATLSDVVERRVGNRILYFSGNRLIGIAVRASGVASVVVMAPGAFEWIGRQASTEIEVARADYIRGLLE